MLEGEIQGRAPRKNQPKIEKPGFLDPRFLAVVVVVFSLSLSLPPTKGTEDWLESELRF